VLYIRMSHELPGKIEESNSFSRMHSFPYDVVAMIRIVNCYHILWDCGKLLWRESPLAALDVT
jgi:hypothetical protein